ncbi:VOC family protein [Anaerosporobacter faecicola]|uniref:VOC family protein n=1 Tax=Anaerosporobacter faecicola TaxID=2718714 RepID=UPI00143A8346|nr:VOC family protein [Anaerosporobacter faecicola]
MKYQCTLLAVKDVAVSKKFYHDLFEQEVVMDFGTNVTFSGGFAIQQGFAELMELPTEQVLEKSNNMELYFEVEDYDQYLEMLSKRSDIHYVHPSRMHPWHQRAVRIYDPDFHIIEIGESMETVVKNLLKQGHSIEETSKMTMYPIPFVEHCKETL